MAKNVKDVKIATEYLELHGFVLKRGQNHLVFTDGNNQMIVSKTPGDNHILHNIKRNLRRFGITPR